MFALCFPHVAVSLLLFTALLKVTACAQLNVFHTYRHTFVLCFLDGVESNLLRQSWSWQKAHLLHHVEATRTKPNQKFLIRNWPEELGQHRLHLNEPDLSFVASAAERTGLNHSYCLFTCIARFSLSATNRKELKTPTSSPEPISDTARPVLVSLPVMARPVLSAPSWL